MANWCSGIIALGTTSKWNVFRLAVKVLAGMNNDEGKFEGDFHDLLKSFGCKDDELAFIEVGSITDYKIEKSLNKKQWGLKLYTDSRWAAPANFSGRLATAAFDYTGVHFDCEFVAEEPGMGVYINTDTTGNWFDDMVIVETMDAHGDWDSYYFGYNDEEKFYKFLKEKTSKIYHSRDEVVADLAELAKHDVIVNYFERE